MMPDTSAIDLVTAILLIVVGVVGLVLNALVILTVLQYKGLRNSFTVIIALICVVHILEYLIPLPLKIVGDLLYHKVPSWTLGVAACKLANYAFYAFTCSIAYCILLLVVDRIFKIEKRPSWYSSSSLAGSAAICLVCLVVNIGVLYVYGLTDELLDPKTKLHICGLTTFKSETLGLFFTFSFLLPVLLTFVGIFYLSRVVEFRKTLQLGNDIDREFIGGLSVIVFSMGSYAILRLIWHVDRLILDSGYKFDQGDLIVQDVAEVTWYMSGLVIAAYVIYVYPGMRNGIKDLCCGQTTTPARDLDYEDELVLMPVVTTEADPKRYDTWPQPGYNQLSGSTPSLISQGSTTIVSKPGAQTEDQNWMIVRTLDRPKPKLKDYVDSDGRERVRPLATSTLDRSRRSERESSARSRSTSPSSEHREDKISTKRRFLKKKKSKSKEAKEMDKSRETDKSREEEEE